MVENHEIHKAIDKRVNVIDSKLKNSFSLIKKDIAEIKEHHRRVGSHPNTAMYEAKIQELKLQSTLDRAAVESKYAQKLSSLENKHEELKHTIFELSKQIQKLHGKKATVQSSKEKKVSRTAAWQILIVLVVVGVLGYLLFSHFVPLTGVIGNGSSSATIGGLTGALLFILVILALLFYSKARKLRKTD